MLGPLDGCILGIGLLQALTLDFSLNIVFQCNIFFATFISAFNPQFNSKCVENLTLLFLNDSQSTDTFSMWAISCHHVKHECLPDVLEGHWILNLRSEIKSEAGTSLDDWILPSWDEARLKDGHFGHLVL